MLLEFFVEKLINKKWANFFSYQTFFRFFFVSITFLKPILLTIDRICSFRNEIKEKRKINRQNYHCGIRAGPPSRSYKGPYSRYAKKKSV